MHPLAPSSERPIGVRQPGFVSHRDATSRVMALAVRRIGYLVPAADFDGDIHSIFAGACNISCGATLLTVVAHGLADGPTTLKLAAGAAPDLRHLFRTGEPVRCRNGIASTPGVELSLAGAAIWRPAPPPRAGSRRRSDANLRQLEANLRQLEANLRFGAVALRHRRLTHSSVLEREAAPVLRALDGAARSLDAGKATALLDRLVGWGEGLTPAGDDFIVGWYASLDALAHGDADRLRFLRALSAAIVQRTSRTTPIAGHCLRLAAHGHFNDDVICLRNALLGGRDRADVDRALAGALHHGATSGADMVTGMIAGIEAWSGAGLGDARHGAPGGARYEAIAG